jgi:cyclophilin family peptidyl-prolyl cis-trans isomerase/protein-disulfide isomerase
MEEAALPRPDDHRKGASENPAVVIIEYADYHCPACGVFDTIMGQLVDEFPADVQVIYRHFPLHSIHPHARKAAEAAEAAAEQEQFWPYHETLFARMRDFSGISAEQARDILISIARDTGLDVARFTEALDSGRHTAKVANMEQEAIAIGLPGTPSVILDGRFVPNAPFQLEPWRQYVQGAIALRDSLSTQYTAPTDQQLDPAAPLFARVELENGGSFVIELLTASAPQTVNSFVFLAREGWFDGVTFHRVLPGFVAQTGDPSGTGRGGPGYMLPNEIDPALSHDAPGVVAMANSGPDTNGSQWYITLAPTTQLDGSYTIFGRITDGMDVVNAITPRNPETATTPGDAILRITIEQP